MQAGTAGARGRAGRKLNCAGAGEGANDEAAPADGRDAGCSSAVVVREGAAGAGSGRSWSAAQQDMAPQPEQAQEPAAAGTGARHAPPLRPPLLEVTEKTSSAQTQK